MKEILANYQKIKEDYCEKKKEINAKIEAKEAKIEIYLDKIQRAEKVIKKYEVEIDDLRRPSTYQDIITPLAEKLSQHFGMPYEIYGPFGIECETSIYLRKDMDASISNQPTISLTLRPTGNCESGLRYNTGKKTNQYAVGSVGWMNGLNDVYEPLPMEFEKILKLVENDSEGGISE